MAVVGIHGDNAPFLMDLDTPSNAEYAKHYIKETQTIDLYPEKKIAPSEKFVQELQETYGPMYEAQDQLKAEAQYRQQFLQETKCDLLTLGIYNNLIRPVQEMQNATTREKDIALDAISNLVHEEGTDFLLDRFKYQNRYLAEIAYCTNEAYENILECMDYKIKEGLSEKDVCEIEDHDIKKYLVDCSHKVPKDITTIITKRVQGAIDDFVDDKKKCQFQIKKIYDKAKEKVDQYNQAQQAMDAVAQTDNGSSGSMDPEVSIDANLNAKLDAQNQQDLMNQAEFSNDPNNQSQVGLQNMQQEAIAYAKSQENAILESNYNVFDAMLRVLVESTHKSQAIKKQYLTEKGKLNFEQLFTDTRAMYTVLEAVNTLNAVHVDADYLKTMIHEMYQDCEASADPIM